MSEAYDAFAYAYDQALGERFFKAIRHVLTDLLRRHPTAGQSHLDLACGTGLAMRFFIERGWTSTGVDASLPMLAVARRRAHRLVAGDVRALPLREPFDCVTSLYDSLNHLKDCYELARTFRQVRALMGKDSLFVFDLNHPEVYPHVWGMDEPYVAQGEGFYLALKTSYRKRERIARGRATGWAQIGGVRVPINELHEQYAFSRAEVESALKVAGMPAVEVMDFDPFGQSERARHKVKLIFVCRVA